MPKITTMRQDVMRNAELDDMLKKAETGAVTYANQTFRFNPKMIKCLTAMLWLFGKRITEVLRVKRADVFVRDQYLCVRFTIQKKKKRKSEPIPQKSLKRITVKNPYVNYILDWANTTKDKDRFLFPGRVRARTIRVKNKETGKVYSYERPAEKRMSRNLAYKILKGLNPKCWLHLFRHSLATEMSERGATEQELMAWFDWSDPKTAHDYVIKGPRLTQKLSRRTW